MKWLRHIVCAVSFGLTSLAASAFAASSPSEAQIKAAILFNLARFSEWSEDHRIPGREFRICTYSNEFMNKALNDLSGKRIHNRPLRVIELGNTKRKSRECEVVFISKDKGYDYIPLQQLHKGGVLTVSDSPEFTKRGGCMSIQRMGNKIKFSINKRAMHSAGIKPSSKIITLAVEPG